MFSGVKGRLGFAALALLVASACGNTQDGDGGASGGATGSGGTSAGGAAGAAGTGGATALSATLPQAIEGAMMANPAAYESVPLHVRTAPPADAVRVDFDGMTLDAEDASGDGDFVVLLPIAGREDGSVSVSATATLDGLESTVTAELVIANRGAQLTDFDVDGAAGTPRLHRRAGELWLTHTDRSGGDKDAYLWRLDGAGRPMGDRISLVGDAEETHQARTAFGDSSIGVLYQQRGGPWVNRFRIVDFDGNELHTPIDLDGSQFGSFGGDVAYDGSGYVVAYRVNDGSGGGEVRWARIDETSGMVTGPVAVATSGEGTAADPIGDFEPFTFVKVRALGEQSFVTFVRGYYLGLLDFEVPKSQVAVVDRDGTVGAPTYFGGETDLRFHRESRVFDSRDGLLLLWSSVDLLDPDPNPNMVFQASPVDSAGTVDSTIRTVLDDVDERNEPYGVSHPSHPGILAWLDHRTYTEDILSGRIQLMVAPLGEDLSVGTPAIFEHADPIAGAGQVHMANAGTNVMMVWVDDIGGILMPRPEIYVDTGWF